jgi:drug/metabolite transporter (DMT)-like permease
LSTALKGHIALFIAQVIYAMNYSIAKGLMPAYMGPMSLVFFRIIGAAVLFWILSLFTKSQKLEKGDMKKMMWLAIFGVAVNQYFFIAGLNLTSPINSSIIMISNPIMVFIFTLVVYKNVVTTFRIAGLALAITGALMILLYRGNFELGSDTVMGDLFTLVNSASWAIFVVMVKPIMQKYNTVTAMKWMFLYGSIYILPFGLSDALTTDWLQFNDFAWFALFFVVVATTFFAYLLNVYGLVGLSANTVSAYIYLQPFLASLFAIALGKDTLTPIKLVSGILIILGLYLINRKTNDRTA